MLYRHNRVWLCEAGWQRALEAVPDVYVAEIKQWVDNNWPAIVRREESGMAQDKICLGIALPPPLHQGRKIRIPFSACTSEVVRHEAPLDMAGAISAMPSAWLAPFAALSQAAGSRQLKFHIYGAVAMQAETRLPYIGASSDIDLLFYPKTRKQLQEGLSLLQEYVRLLPLDGEIIFPCGRAVAWKEWAFTAENPESMRVITKSMHGVNLTLATHLLSGLD